MEYKQLGTTSAMVPEIGLGTWAYTGGPESLLRGIELGAFFIDTAEVYGTEAVVGKAVRKIREKVIISTKVFPDHFRRNDLINAAEGSMKRLGVQHIDLYQLHWPSLQVPIEETMGALETLVDQGKVRFIGVSNFSPQQMLKAQAALTRTRIVSNQAQYSLIKRDIERDVLPYCQEHGITLIAYRPIGQGLNHILQKDRLGAIKGIARSTGKSAAQIALNWCISKDRVMAIPKANSLAHVEEDCLASGWQLSQDHLTMLDQSFQ